MCYMATPDRVGIRELRQNLSVYVRRVKKGETIEVTERGEPVARLAPVSTGVEWLDRMVAEGKIRPARKKLSELPPPVKLPPGDMSISEALQEQREERLP